MMLLLLQKEGIVTSGKETHASYAKIISKDMIFRDEWLGIFHKERRIGYSHTSIVPDIDAHKSIYRLTNATFFTLSLLGKDQFVNFSSEVIIDELYMLQEFEVSLRSSGYEYFVRGKKKKEDVYTLTLNNGTIQSFEKTIAADSVVLNILMPFSALLSQKPGSIDTFTTFNPLTMKTEKIRVTTIDEPSNNGDECTRFIITNSADVEIEVFATKNGGIDRVLLPFNISLQSESVEKATNLSLHVEGDDLYSEVAIPAIIEKNEALLEYLKIRITGNTDAISELSTPYQVIEKGANAITVTTVLPDMPQKIENTFSESIAKSLEATVTIQKDHPRIVEQMEEIVGKEIDEIAKVRSLLHWVFESIEQTPTVSIPSAVDVLDLRRGDCNEITILFVALCRAAGIPAYPVLGLMYSNGAFFYHSWALVYLESWFPVDPTFNQFPADVTHVQLGEGTISQYYEITNIVGKIDITILDYN